MTKELEAPPRDFDENPEWTEDNFSRARQRVAWIPAPS